MTRSIFLLLATFFVAACHDDEYSKSVFKEREALSEIKKNIVVGMSTAQVQGIAGEPSTSQISSGGWEEYRYGTDVVAADKGKETIRGFVVNFENGKVFSVEDIVAYAD